MNKLLLSIKVRLIDHIGKLFHRFGYSFYYTNKYGVKVINRTSGEAKHKQTNESFIELNPRALYLPFDFLKDEFTLLDTNIMESPHYKLICGCDEGNLENNEYINRAICGTLDGRDSTYETVERYLKCYSEKQKDFQENQIEAIRFYTVGRKKYIADGKHRAAMAAYHGWKITGKEIYPINIITPNVKRMYSIMKKKPESYLQNINHLEQLMKDMSVHN